jgi:hypothetical protein
MNRFFSLMEANPRIKGKIKILGIGAGNTSFEVNTFKRSTRLNFRWFRTRILPFTKSSAKSARRILLL